MYGVLVRCNSSDADDLDQDLMASYPGCPLQYTSRGCHHFRASPRITPHSLSNRLAILTTTEETGDIAYDASALDVKTALEMLANVGTVNVTREEAGNGLYAWRVTFTEPAFSAYSVGGQQHVELGSTVSSAVLSFPLLYAGGAQHDSGLGLETLGTDGKVNVTISKKGTLGPLSGEVRSEVLIYNYVVTDDSRYIV